MNKVIWILSLFFLLFHSSCTDRLPALFQAKVIGVKDGDTIVVLYNSESITIRIMNIDCPEKSQPYGQNAKRFTSNFCFGKNVTVNSTQKKDKYGRMIADIIVNLEPLSEQLLKNGLAWQFLRYSNDSYLATIQDSAKSIHLGLWADENPIPPWVWRLQKRTRQSS